MAKIERPTPFGRYELLRRIGAGGMGEVFLARLPGLGGADKVCVVKKILPHLVDDRGFVARFVDEGKVVIHLSHGNIAQVFEMGDVEGEFYMAMEYVEGKTLAKLASRVRERGETFPIELALLIGIKLLEGLAYAHRKSDPTGRPLSVVHRDISPSNVMLTYDGDLKIIDFGAALSTFKEEMTAPRVVIGNLTYMAPEHARKQHVDARADLFSAGVVLWELVSWQVMPTDGDHVERWKRAARPNFEKASTFRAGVPREVDLILAKALQVDLRERYQDAEMFRDDLQIALARTAPTTTQRALTDFMRRYFDVEQREERRTIAEVLSVPKLGESRRQIPIPREELAEPSRRQIPVPREEPPPAVSRRQIPVASDDEPPESTDPELKRSPIATSEPTPTPTENRPGGEHTTPGAEPPPPVKAPEFDRASLAASMRSTMPGRPPVFGDDDEPPPLPSDEESTVGKGASNPPQAEPKPASKPQVAPVDSAALPTAPPAPVAERPKSPTQSKLKAAAPPPPAKSAFLWVVVGAALGFVLVVALLSFTLRR